ncbi:hypothetical protein DHEL01_v202375 [Diaporthe helianthi]|uniref:Uncharacterized protein n=1 Tax=Diaporthe helianthi TaxID=158607 RepID=A0A2P5I9P5_DIAHE|nr:hypothetical protein DHEL01_v202375 [Diaporthe helianthi]
MANHFAAASPTVLAAKGQPIFLPGFDRVTQLGMEFNTLTFASAWLRKTYTSDHARSIQVCLAAEDHYRRERLLQEVRYGNNITLLFKACYEFREFRMSDDLWKAVGRVYGVTPEVVRSVVDLYVKAREIFLRNYQPDRGTPSLRTTATHWADKWIMFIDGRDGRRPPAIYDDVFAGVNVFFRQEEQATNGDLARILSTARHVGAPMGPHALRKRSLSPCPLESSPVAKKRIASTSTDGTGTQATSVSFGSKNEYQSDQKHADEPYFQLKIRGIHNSPPCKDSDYSLADDYEALVRSNIELQARVESLEKERLESTKAQNDRDHAIRTLQAKFMAFEKVSAAAHTQKSVNNEVVREMQDVTRKLGAQTEKLQKIEKELKNRDQAAHTMQTTISSLQEDLARREKDLEAQKKDFSEMLTRVMSLEAKNVFLNNLHKTVRDLRAELACEVQKDRASALSLDSANEQKKQDAKLKATEEALEKQGQTIERAMDRVLALEDQALKSDARIEPLRKQPDLTKDIPRLWVKMSAMNQTQVDNIKKLDANIQTLRAGLEQTRAEIGLLSKRLVTGLGDLPTIQKTVSETQTKITNIEQHRTEISKRLDDVEVSQKLVALQDHSARIDELSQSIETLNNLSVSLANADDVRLAALRAELDAFYQKQAEASQQQAKQAADTDDTIRKVIEQLEQRLDRIDRELESYMVESRGKFDQLVEGDAAFGRHVERAAKESSNVAAVVDSLCQRVGIMENGFVVMRDVMRARRR